MALFERRHGSSNVDVFNREGLPKHERLSSLAATSVDLPPPTLNGVAIQPVARPIDEMTNHDRPRVPARLLHKHNINEYNPLKKGEKVGKDALLHDPDRMEILNNYSKTRLLLQSDFKLAQLAAHSTPLLHALNHDSSSMELCRRSKCVVLDSSHLRNSLSLDAAQLVAERAMARDQLVVLNLTRWGWWWGGCGQGAPPGVQQDGPNPLSDHWTQKLYPQSEQAVFLLQTKHALLALLPFVDVLILHAWACEHILTALLDVPEDYIHSGPVGCAAKLSTLGGKANGRRARTVVVIPAPPSIPAPGSAEAEAEAEAANEGENESVGSPLGWNRESPKKSLARNIPAWPSDATALARHNKLSADVLPAAQLESVVLPIAGLSINPDMGIDTSSLAMTHTTAVSALSSTREAHHPYQHGSTYTVSSVGSVGSHSHSDAGTGTNFSTGTNTVTVMTDDSIGRAGSLVQVRAKGTLKISKDVSAAAAAAVSGWGTNTLRGSTAAAATAAAAATGSVFAPASQLSTASGFETQNFHSSSEAHGETQIAIVGMHGQAFAVPDWPVFVTPTHLATAGFSPSGAATRQAEPMTTSAAFNTLRHAQGFHKRVRRIKGRLVLLPDRQRRQDLDVSASSVVLPPKDSAADVHFGGLIDPADTAAVAARRMQATRSLEAPRSPHLASSTAASGLGLGDERAPVSSYLDSLDRFVGAYVAMLLRLEAQLDAIHAAAPLTAKDIKADYTPDVRRLSTAGERAAYRSRFNVEMNGDELSPVDRKAINRNYTNQARAIFRPGKGHGQGQGQGQPAAPGGETEEGKFRTDIHNLPPARGSVSAGRRAIVECCRAGAVAMFSEDAFEEYV